METATSQVASSPEFPDDPRKWNGWSYYCSDNLYARLCLDPKTQPGNDEIQQNYNALLHWWQKKLPLKNQPSNPLAQLLGRGIDEAGRYLAQAQLQLCDPARRREIDAELAAVEQQAALAEFAKYIAFSIKAGVLTPEAEADLTEYGQRNGLRLEQIRSSVDSALRERKARRAPKVQPAPEKLPALPPSAEPEKDFLRILRLSEVNMGSATDSVRSLLATIAHNLGLHSETAYDLLDDYLEKEELALCRPVPTVIKPVMPARVAPPAPVTAAAARPAPMIQPPPIRLARPKVEPGRLPPPFLNPLGAPMLPIPGGEFIMGSDASDAAPNEQPLTPVKVSQFYISRYLVTNLLYEQFDPSHARKRMPGAGDDHPVVYVSSLEALKFAEWLGQKDGRRYRLPTEAEWEYAARGFDSRKYPWGNQEGRGDLANFADLSTTFPWRHAHINDGYAESSPVGAFPNGASFFGVHDMAGNVWEWCLDFYQPLAGTPKQDPRGGTGGKRVYRGGSWKSRFSNLRATARASNAPNYSCNDIGFRIVCESGRSEVVS